MSELVTTCPRCNATNTTFDVLAATAIRTLFGWQTELEAFCVCRHCKRSTVIMLREREEKNVNKLNANGGIHGYKGSLNRYFHVDDYVSLKHHNAVAPPEHLPPAVEEVFREGANCMAIGCFNAAGTMFRLCLDMATKSFLPEANDNGLNNKIRRNLGFRMIWLFDNDLLPRALQDLAACVKEDGNDGAHEGTLTKADAEDLLDFTEALLERLYTEPARIRLANERRAARRQGGN